MRKVQLTCLLMLIFSLKPIANFCQAEPDLYVIDLEVLCTQLSR